MEQFRFLRDVYIDYAQPLNVIPRNAYRTHIDYHLVDYLSQKAAVDLSSRIPSLALDTTLAPENPRTK